MDLKKIILIVMMCLIQTNMKKIIANLQRRSHAYDIFVFKLNLKIYIMD